MVLSSTLLRQEDGESFREHDSDIYVEEVEHIGVLRPRRTDNILAQNL